MNKYLSLMALLFSFAIAGAQTKLISVSKSGTTPVALLQAYSNKAVYSVDHYKIVYETRDVDGTTTIASGALLLPVSAPCTDFPVAVYAHGTVLDKESVPSRNNLESIIPKIFASTGAVAVAPDYLGLGDSPGLHPYLHAESEATASLDLVRAVREYINDSTQMQLNGEVYVTGYSQGGHAAMATVKYVQDEGLQNEFNIIGAGPASGPYNLSGSQQEVLVSNQPYSNPGYVVYLVLAMNKVYGNIFTNYSDILKAPYDTLIPPYFDGSYSMLVVNSLLPTRLSDFMQDSVLQNFKNDSVAKNHPIWQALLAQDNYNWVPQFPMEMYYCTQDEQVSFQNALDAEAYMQANGAPQVSAVNRGALDHGGCVLPAMAGALDHFSALRSACTVGLDEEALSQVKLYPNPASDYLKLEGFEGELGVTIYDPTAGVVLRQQVTAGQKLLLGSLPAGMYLLTAESEGLQKLFKIVVQ